MEFKEIKLKEAVFTKNNNKFIFRYKSGEEAILLENLIHKVSDPDSGLDWGDLAIISDQIAFRMPEVTNK